MKGNVNESCSWDFLYPVYRYIRWVNSIDRYLIWVPERKNIYENVIALSFF